MSENGTRGNRTTVRMNRRKVGIGMCQVKGEQRYSYYYDIINVHTKKWDQRGREGDGKGNGEGQGKGEEEREIRQRVCTCLNKHVYN